LIEHTPGGSYNVPILTYILRPHIKDQATGVYILFEQTMINNRALNLYIGHSHIIHLTEN